jgi:hypothetical protein
MGKAKPEGSPINCFYGSKFSKNYQKIQKLKIEMEN